MFNANSKQKPYTMVPQACKGKNQKNKSKTQLNVEMQSVPVIYQNNQTSQVEIKDCGFFGSWQYKCPPQAVVRSCDINSSNGAWVPAVIYKNDLYYQCEIIKNTPNRKEFNSAFNQEF
jgi:hypothetical protein